MNMTVAVEMALNYHYPLTHSYLFHEQYKAPRPKVASAQHGGGGGSGGGGSGHGSRPPVGRTGE